MIANDVIASETGGSGRFDSLPRRRLNTNTKRMMGIIWQE